MFENITNGDGDSEGRPRIFHFPSVAIFSCQMSYCHDVVFAKSNQLRLAVTFFKNKRFRNP